MKRLLALLALLVAAGAGLLAFGSSGSSEVPQPAPAQRTAVAVVASGCFWCTESDFDHVAGVISTTSGYTGGRVANPTYHQVSEGNTGHFESVRIVYDPARVSYAQLIGHLFRTSDPFDSGGSFCDRGSQYRSAIFVRTPEERRIAEAVKARVERQLGRRPATPILPAGQFYPAEEYHQDYYRKNPLRYRYYRWNCGRDRRIQEVWAHAR
ncbi:MAG TPA: peptide-methionine (S)-S-oxide reductase MsrA [Allosphingosinicella sp.]|jgi:peptide-methionine (S)-S-oxide reductase|nr:peptide-methionine (S)-S-oxide reductase MsrA [Allosphingosinicella sp.]